MNTLLFPMCCLDIDWKAALGVWKPVKEQEHDRPGEVADDGRSHVRPLTRTEQVMPEEYSSCQAGCMRISMVLRKSSWGI